MSREMMKAFSMLCFIVFSDLKVKKSKTAKKAIIRAHNPKVVGSNPTPATNTKSRV